MLLKTPLHTMHQDAGAKLVDFAGFEMPLHYGSQLEEHHAVRQDAGVFYVSHMAVVDVRGKQARAFLRYVLANNIDKLQTPGKALYSCLLNNEGGVIDDLIAYWLGEERFRLVINASRREKDLAWLKEHATPFQVDVALQKDLALLALQGPNAIARAKLLFDEATFERIQLLKPFSALEHQQWLVARTGYTGEDGLEMAIPFNEVEKVW